jgi:sec-independent protein translocase protein TatA
MLGLDNPIHIAFILILLLLVFGAKRLPELGRSLGTGLRGFKESISGEDSPAHVGAPTPVPVSAAPTPAHADALTMASPVTATRETDPALDGVVVRGREHVGRRGQQ